MPFVARARSLWRNLVARSRVEQDLDDELHGYVQLVVAEKVRAGVPLPEARRQARLEVGGVEQVKEQVRDARGGALVESVLQDLRYAVRTLRRAPGFAAASIVALALGIGATVAIFSVVHAVLLRPLPYVEPDRLVLLGHEVTGPASPANYLDWQRESRSYAAMGAAQAWTATLGGASPERVGALRVTPEVLPLTGARPLLGRLPATPAGGGDALAEVVLSWGFWQRRFAGSADALGATLLLDGAPHTVVGVMPAGFDFPIFWAGGAELWGPLPLAARADQRGGRSLRVFGRLRDGVTLEQARGELAALTARLDQQYPGSNRDVTLTRLDELVVGDVRPALLVLLGAVSLLLLIACANVAHMQLARAADRERELTVRVALGAARGRLVRQLLTESLVLALAGGAAGLLLAHWGAQWLVTLGGASIPRAAGVALSPAVLGFALLVSLGTGIAFGLLPALRAARGELATRLRDGARGLTAGGQRATLRGALTVSQVALALLLLAGAGLLLRSFAALRALDPGFDARPMLSVVLSTTGTSHEAPERRVALFDETVRRVRALPGVAAASAVNHLPLAGDNWGTSVYVEGAPRPAAGEGERATFRVAHPGYFEAMRIPVVRGRALAEGDREGSTPVVVINEWMAERYWPGRDPIGQRLTLDDPDDDPEWLTVAGVVRNVVRSDWTAPPEAEVYLPFHQTATYLRDEGGHVGYLTLVVRAACAPEGGRCDPAALAGPVRNVVRALAPDVPVSEVQTLERVIAAENAQPRFNLVLLALFAAAALALAAVGIYGVMSYTVARRTHELGLRMALGARAADVQRLVLGRALALTLLGTALGVVGALGLARLMSGMLYGVRAGDPLTLAAVAALLALVAIVACAVPAWRASRIAPAVALRSD